MKQLLLTFSVWAISLATVYAQGGLPGVAWQNVYGGNKDDAGISFAPTKDGGYIVLGTTASDAKSGDVSERRGTTTSDKDYWITKLDAAGTLQWEKTYGGTKEEALMGQILQTLDGGYIVAGSTYSTDLDISGNAGKLDIWVLKLRSDGTIDWQKTYGTAEEDYGKTVLQTPDSGFVIGGAVAVPNTGGGSISLIPPSVGITMKIDKSGNQIWRNEYQLTPDVTDVIGIMSTNDGGLAFAGRAGRPAGTSAGTMAKAGKADYYWAKLDTAGRELEHTVLGGSLFDYITTGVRTPDGGFVLCGHTHSQDSSLTGVKKNADDISDLWIVKIDSLGKNILWSKSYGGSSADSIAYLAATPDGGFVVAANTRSSDGDISGPNNGLIDVWILKLDANGNLEWEDNFGGSNNDFVRGVLAGDDGTITIMGNTSSTDLDVTGITGKGGIDYWIVKFEAPQPDSIVVSIKNNLAPKITTAAGNLQLEAVLYPRILSQDFTWSIVPGSGTATIDANGLVTAGDSGTVWAKAVWQQNTAFADSIEIAIEIADDPGFVGDLNTAANDISVYPNPAATQIVLQSAAGHPALTMTVYDLAGKAVYRSALREDALIQPYALDISMLPSGNYLLELNGSVYKAVKNITIR